MSSIDLWDSVKQIRDIFNHLSSHTRSESDPYLGNPRPATHVVFRDAEGRPSMEPRRLLGLTARSRPTDIPTTHWDVIRYIKELVDEKIQECRAVTRPSLSI